MIATVTINGVDYTWFVRVVAYVVTAFWVGVQIGFLGGMAHAAQIRRGSAKPPRGELD